MAEVIDHWPPLYLPPNREYFYPWDQWTALDENGHGDIWLATAGIDYPQMMSPQSFKSLLWTRSTRINRKRRAEAGTELRVVQAKTGERTVQPVSTYRKMCLKTVIVSLESVAFQYYDSTEPPPDPNTSLVAIPTRKRRKPLHRHRVRRVLEDNDD